MVNKAKYSEIFGSTSKYSFLRILFFLISYVFYILISRFLGPEEFGKLALLIQLGAEFGTILVIGFPIALNKFIPNIPDKKDKSILFSTTIKITLLMILVFTFVYFILTYYLKEYIPPEIIEAKYFLYVFIIVIGFVRLGIGMLSGLGRFITGTVLDGTIHILWRLIAFSFIFFLAYKKFTLVFSVNFAVHFIVMFIIFFILRGYFSRSGIKIDPKILKFSALVTINQLINSAIILIDLILVRYILNSTGEVGYYYTGTRIPLLFQTLFFIPLTIPFLYYFSKPDITLKIKDTIIKFGTKIITVVFSIIALFIYTVADKFILILFGQDYSNSIIILKIFAFTLFFIAIESFMNPFFLSINKPIIPLVLGIIYLVSLAGLDFILIPYFNSAGPAVAALIVLFVRTTIYMILLWKNKINFLRPFIILFAILAFSISVDIFLLSYTGIFIYIILIFITRMLTIGDIKKMILLLRKKEVI